MTIHVTIQENTLRKKTSEHLWVAIAHVDDVERDVTYLAHGKTMVDAATHLVEMVLREETSRGALHQR